MKRIVSGITPSGDGSLHIGNYLGAVRQFIEMAKTNECFLFIADLHALTTVQNKAQFQHNVETLILNELALLGGFLTEEEFKRLIFYRQSDIGPHPELQTILNNVTPLGLLKRAHAYKDKLAKDVMEDEINLGLFNYPILMAADILMYKPDLVPVGKDQKQHVEITRDIAQRFNKTFSPIFPLPDAYIPESVAVVIGTDGQRKMSKSLGNIIGIFDDEAVIKKQVMSTYTDPTRAHANDPGHVEGNMVFTYLEYFGDPTSSRDAGLRGAGKVEQLKELYRAGKVSDVEVKEYLFESLMKTFAPARKRYEELKANPQMVKDILEKGAIRAQGVAKETMEQVRNAIGLTNRYSFIRPPLAETPSAPFEAQGKSSGGKGEAFNTKTISIDEFGRVELRVGKVVEARNKEGSEKLIRLVVDVGDPNPRIIFTGVRGFGYTPEDFAGKQFFFITNLAPRKMMDEESQGMILAVDGADGKPQFVSAEKIPIGAKIR
jgi:tryptophanyl-tRNA synthetase